MNIALTLSALAWNNIVPTALASAAAQTGIGLGATNTVAGTTFDGIIRYLAEFAIPVVNVIAIVTMVMAGIGLTFSQEEGKISTLRTTFIASIFAIFATWAAGAIQNALYGVGRDVVSNPEVSANLLGDEIIGITNWIMYPLATIAVLMIIVTGMRAVANWGSGDSTDDIRRAVISITFGMALIAARFAITRSITITGSPDGIVGAFVAVANRILGFMGLVAVIVIIIAGIMMVANLGNDEQYKRARDIILRVAIGIVIIAASWAIVNIFFIATT